MDVLYFTCLWEPYPVAWLSIKPYIKGYKIGSVKWRGEPITVEVFSGEKVEIDKRSERIPPDLYALLKSNLQKQIRQGKIGAIATANKLWELGQFELLRRLVVIASEDVILSTETAVIVWLMVAKSKGMVLNDTHRQWVLGYVKSLLDNRNKWHREGDAELDSVQILDSSHSQSEQLMAIFFRTAYGGLACDSILIKRYVKWFITTNNRLPTLGTVPFIDELPKLCINRAAIDHHVYPQLSSIISKELSDLSPKQIENIIWNCSSSRNYRKPRKVSSEDRKDWKRIKPLFTEFTKEYLSKIIERHQL